jgi:hypothetical protein
MIWRAPRRSGKCIGWRARSSSKQANGGKEIDDVEVGLVECRQAGRTGVVVSGGLLTLAWRDVSNEGADVARADLGYAVCRRRRVVVVQ